MPIQEKSDKNKSELVQKIRAIHHLTRFVNENTRKSNRRNTEHLGK